MTNAARDGKDLEPLSEAAQVRSDMVEWIAQLAQHNKEMSRTDNAIRLAKLANFLEALSDDDPLIPAEAQGDKCILSQAFGDAEPLFQVGDVMHNWHDQRIEEWFDYMAEFLR